MLTLHIILPYDMIKKKRRDTNHNREKIIKELKRNQSIVLVTKSSNHNKILLQFCKKVAKQFKNIIFVTITKPFNKIRAELEIAGVDTSNYVFIDCISSRYNVEVKDSKNCVYVGSPEMLTDVSAAISRALQNQNALLLLDDVSSLAIYNENTNVLKFLQGTIIRLQKQNAKGIFLMLDDNKKEDMIKDLSLFTDKIIRS